MSQRTPKKGGARLVFLGTLWVGPFRVGIALVYWSQGPCYSLPHQLPPYSWVQGYVAREYELFAFVICYFDIGGMLFQLSRWYRLGVSTNDGLAFNKFKFSRGVLAPVTSHVKRCISSNFDVIEWPGLNPLAVLGFLRRLFSRVDFINPWMRNMRRVKNP